MSQNINLQLTETSVMYDPQLGEDVVADPLAESNIGNANLEKIQSENTAFIGRIAVAERSSEGYGALLTATEELGQKLPYVAEHQKTIEQGGKQLVEEYGIGSEFFKSPTHVLFFSALAERMANLNEAQATMTEQDSRVEKQFIEDATMMLALDKSARYDEFKSRLSKEGLEDEKALEGIHDRFTQKQVTAELQETMNDGDLLKEVKERLNLTGRAEEEPYVLHVLNIADENTLYGMHPDIQEINNLPTTDPRFKAGLDEALSYKEYASGLKTKTEEFKQAVGMDRVPAAWIVKINGKNHLNIPLPVAEKVLYRDEKRNPSYTDDDLKRDISIISHEYAHTQRSLVLDGHLYYGIAADERKAEHGAGDRMGYQDIKGFMDFDMPLVSDGTKFTRVLQESSGDKADVYTRLASKIGLQRTLEFALTVPRTYISENRPAQKAVNEYLDGINGLEARLYEDNSVEARDRIDARVQKWAVDMAKDEYVDMWLNIREKSEGLRFVTQKLRQALEEERARAEAA